MSRNFFFLSLLRPALLLKLAGRGRGGSPRSSQGSGVYRPMFSVAGKVPGAASLLKEQQLRQQQSSSASSSFDDPQQTSSSSTGGHLSLCLSSSLHVLHSMQSGP